MKNILFLILTIGLLASCSLDNNTEKEFLMDADNRTQKVQTQTPETILQQNDEPRVGKSYIEYVGEIDIDVNNPEAAFKSKELEEPRPQQRQ